MLRKSLLWIPFCVLLCWQVPANSDEPKTVDEVIANYIEAIGGRKALDSVKSMRVTGKMVMQGGMEFPFLREIKRPNKMRLEFCVQGMTIIRAYDGETGWFVMPPMGKVDPERMSDDDVKDMQDEADIDGPLVDYKKKGHQVELISKEEFEGSETYKLKVTLKSGDIEYRYLDAEYFLPIKIKGQREFQGSPIEYEITLGDYKEVAGLLIPHSIEQGGSPMGKITMSCEKVEVNVELPDDRFTMPEVKKAPTVPTVTKDKADDKAKSR